MKYRKALLDPEVTKIIKETAVRIEDRYAIELETLGTDQNRIHVLCRAHPKVGARRMLQVFRSLTAREIFRKRPAVKRELGGEEFWSDGYYVATVGERAKG